MNLNNRVLILYQFSNHNQLINALCENLNQNNVIADSFNTVSWRFSSFRNNKRPLLISILFPLMYIPKLRGLILNIFRKKILVELSQFYSVIDIHFFSSIYDELIDVFLFHNKKVKITIWGSDFYRTDVARREVQRKYYHKVDTIHLGTLQMKNDFLQVYPECESKIRLAQFGIFQFDNIDKLLKNKDVLFYKKELKLPNDKINLICGLNGNEGHQHSLIIESIQKLTDEVKSQLFIIVPMTYGANTVYISQINNRLIQLGIPFIQLTHSLSVVDICKLRIVGDIVITIQKSDAFSAAVQEHIYAGGILIAGDWLPYGKFDENGIHYKTTSLDNLSQSIEDCTLNFETDKSACFQNKTNIEKISSWKSTIKDWIAMYDEL